MDLVDAQDVRSSSSTGLFMFEITSNTYSFIFQLIFGSPKYGTPLISAPSAAP